MNKVQIIIISFSVIIVIVALLTFAFKDPPPDVQISTQSGQLVIWGIDPITAFEPVFKTYEGENRVRIVYVEKDARAFDKEILEALASQQPPDLVMVPDSWIRNNKDKIAPPKPSIINVDLAKQSVVELAASLLIEEKIVAGELQKTIWGLPLWLDPLVLFWNKDMFEQTSPEPIAKPPEDWDVFLQDSKKMTLLGDGKQVVRAGAALGRAQNIPLYKEILSLLLLQLGADIEGSMYTGASKEKTDSALSAIRFYTDFGNPNTAPGGAYSWNARMPAPRALFAEGKLGMMIDLYSFARELKIKNPHLVFDIAPAPQVRERKRVNYAHIRAITVPRTSKNQDAAWVLAKWLASTAQVEKILKAQSAAPAIRELLEGDKTTGLLKTASLTARRPLETYPDTNSRILKDLIESVADGKAPTEALFEASDAYNIFLKSRKSQ